MTLISILSEFNGHIDEAKIHDAIKRAYHIGFGVNKKPPVVSSNGFTNDKDLTEHMLNEVEKSLYENDNQNDFIESLREQFDARGTLSPKQIDALRKFYDRI